MDKALQVTILPMDKVIQVMDSPLSGRVVHPLMASSLMQAMNNRAQSPLEKVAKQPEMLQLLSVAHSIRSKNPTSNTVMVKRSVQVMASSKDLMIRKHMGNSKGPMINQDMARKSDQVTGSSKFHMNNQDLDRKIDQGSSKGLLISLAMGSSRLTNQKRKTIANPLKMTVDETPTGMVIAAEVVTPKVLAVVEVVGVLM